MRTDDRDDHDHRDDDLLAFGVGLTCGLALGAGAALIGVWILLGLA